MSDKFELKYFLSFLQNVQKLNNRYKHFLTVAALPDTIWTKVETTFKKWESRELKKQPRGAVKQTLFMYIKNVDHSHQALALDDLNAGNITVPEFLARCGKPR